MLRFLPLCRGVVPTELIRRPALLQGLTSLAKKLPSLRDFSARRT